MARRTLIDLKLVRESAEVMVATLKLLANPERLLLLSQLSRGEASVGELEDQLGIRQPTLSQQLGVLRAHGVVETRRDGKRIYYRIADPSLHQIIAMLCVQHGR